MFLMLIMCDVRNVVVLVKFDADVMTLRVLGHSSVKDKTSNIYNLNTTKPIMTKKFLRGIATIGGSSWVVPRLLQQSKMADSGHIEFVQC